MFNGCVSLRAQHATKTSVTFRKMLSATTNLKDHPMLDIHITTQHILNYPPYAYWKFCTG